MYTKNVLISLVAIWRQQKPPNPGETVVHNL